MTEGERDALIMRLHRGANWSQHRIAVYLGMTQPEVKHAIDRMRSKKRG